ncbi:aspartic peptidase domain-containing protein [Apiospora hydei]|uniref:Aspartic peptidase domain-containing protein n=1 Tax=Apiospora hydei TaxID=1337664 RepID=A0ABR1VJX3_9PEZI
MCQTRDAKIAGRNHSFAASEARPRAQELRTLHGNEPPPSTPRLDDHNRRANAATGNTTNELRIRLAGPNLTYTAEFGIGTPQQKLELGITTTLSVVPLHDDSLLPPCEGDGCPYGTYDPTVSSSSEGKEKYTMQDPKGAHGQFFIDTWQVGNARVANVSFSANAGDTREHAFVGLGGVMKTENTSRPSLTAAFVAAGLTTTSAYSVWLGERAPTAGRAGSLVFGGIDTQKFQGTLTRLKTYPLQLDETKDGRLGVQLSSIMAVSITGTDMLACGTQPLLVEIVMGASQIRLPGDLVEAIYKEVGATPDTSRDGAATIPCHMGNSPAYFSFVFSAADGATPSTGAMVNVSMSSLVLPNNLDTNRVSKDMFNDPQSPTYLAFDQENGEIGIAQSNPTPSGSYMIPFPSKGALIPLATPASQTPGPFPSSVVTSSIAPLPTYSAADGFQNYETARPPPAVNSSTEASTSPNQELVIGLGAGLPCGAVAVFTGFMAYWRIKLRRPIPILSRFSKRRWINPYATELEVKHPQPDAAEAVGFPWTFDRPVGWTELDAPAKPVELEGDYSFYQHPIPCRHDSMSSTAVDTEEARSAVAARESLIVPGGIPVATSPNDGGTTNKRGSDSYIDTTPKSPLRMSYVPGPDVIDVGVLADHPENFKDTRPNLPEESQMRGQVATDYDNESSIRDESQVEEASVGEYVEIARRTPYYTMNPSRDSPQPPLTPPPPGSDWT